MGATSVRKVVGKITKKSWAQLNEENKRLQTELRDLEEIFADYKKTAEYMEHMLASARNERDSWKESAQAAETEIINTVCPCGGDVAVGAWDTPRTAVLYQGRLYHTEGHRTAYL